MNPHNKLVKGIVEIEKYHDTIPKITAHEPPTILRLKTNLN